MKSVHVLILISIWLVQVCRGENDCPEKYPADHTMCVYTDSPNVVSTGVSDEDKDFIVEFHNDRRAIVQPSGTDLFKMVWDDKLAVVAEKLAKQCVMKHDTNRGEPDYPGIDVGQNCAMAGSWQTTLELWYNETALYTYGNGDNWKKVAHYTQMVSNRAYRIGCGFAKCSSGNIFVCNYARGQMDTAYPYTKGAQCSDCPNNCKDDLCDCGGLMCLNGGTLNVDQCTCSCPNGYTGEDCKTFNCPPKDLQHCKYYAPQGYTCEAYANIPVECPYMCGKCKKNGNEDKTTPVPKTTRADCPDADISQCDGIDEIHCENSPSIRKYCPYKCKLCTK